MVPLPESEPLPMQYTILSSASEEKAPTVTEPDSEPEEDSKNVISDYDDDRFIDHLEDLIEKQV